MKMLRNIGSLAFVLGLFTVVFARTLRRNSKQFLNVFFKKRRYPAAVRCDCALMAQGA
jgi:hypothetical protein